MPDVTREEKTIHGYNYKVRIWYPNAPENATEGTILAAYDEDLAKEIQARYPGTTYEVISKEPVLGDPQPQLGGETKERAQQAWKAQASKAQRCEVCGWPLSYSESSESWYCPNCAFGQAAKKINPGPEQRRTLHRATAPKYAEPNKTHYFCRDCKSPLRWCEKHQMYHHVFSFSPECSSVDNPGNPGPQRKWSASQVWAACKRAGVPVEERDVIVKRYQETGELPFQTWPSLRLIESWPEQPILEPGTQPEWVIYIGRREEGRETVLSMLEKSNIKPMIVKTAYGKEGRVIQYDPLNKQVTLDIGKFHQSEISAIREQPQLSPGTLPPITKVTVTRAEGPAELCGTWTFTGPGAVAQADDKLMVISRTAPKGGLYDKCDVIIEFANGETWKSRHDVQYMNIDKGVIDHAIRVIEFALKDRPQHMLELLPQWEVMLTWLKAAETKQESFKKGYEEAKGMKEIAHEQREEAGGTFDLYVYGDRTWKLHTPEGVAEGKYDEQGFSSEANYQHPIIRDWINEQGEILFGKVPSSQIDTELERKAQQNWDKLGEKERRDYLTDYVEKDVPGAHNYDQYSWASLPNNIKDFIRHAYARTGGEQRYVVEADVTERRIFYVTAKNEEDAKQKIRNHDYHDEQQYAPHVINFTGIRPARADEDQYYP